MILQQFYLNCLAHASYLIGDESSQTAVVVDPQRDIEQYVVFAREKGVRITHVFLTHLHADFLAGHLELRSRTGAIICLGAKATAEYAFQGMKDGDTVDLGRVRLTALETPGHTPESISVLVFDLAKSETAPTGVLTGDALFIGDVGRPDLLGSKGVTAEQMGGLLYDSLHQKLMTLDDDVLVYPAHGAGSLCGKNLSKDTVSTIGRERTTNVALRPMTRDQFLQVRDRLARH